MFKINKDDLSIYITQGDICHIKLSAKVDDQPYEFQAGDVVRMNIFAEKECEHVVMKKDFPILENSQYVEIVLDSDETNFGEKVNKPENYWYDIVLNPDTLQQSIVCYDDNGAKIFRIFPSGDN